MHASHLLAGPLHAQENICSASRVQPLSPCPSTILPRNSGRINSRGLQGRWAALLLAVSIRDSLAFGLVEASNNSRIDVDPGHTAVVMY